jgi:RNA polymerase sigma-70 factor (ECF subfamily)
LTQGPANVQTDELLSGVVERLMKAMREVRPATVRQFFALANRHIRWELNDLARRLDKRAEVLGLDEAYAAPGDSDGDSRVGTNGHGILLVLDNLPEDEREAFDLVRLQGLTKAEAAGVLGVSEKTVQRRLSRGLAQLTELLGDALAVTEPPQAPVPKSNESGGVGAET